MGDGSGVGPVNEREGGTRSLFIALPLLVEAPVSILGEGVRSGVDFELAFAALRDEDREELFDFTFSATESPSDMLTVGPGSIEGKFRR